MQSAQSGPKKTQLSSVARVQGSLRAATVEALSIYSYSLPFHFIASLI